MSRDGAACWQVGVSWAGLEVVRHGTVAGRVDDLSGYGPRDLVDLIMGVDAVSESATDDHRGDD